jgi:hypothetical protein
MFVFGRNTEVVAPCTAVVVLAISQTVIIDVAKKYGAVANVIESEVEITKTATKTTTMVTLSGNTSTIRYGAAWWIETVSLANNR